MNAGASARGFRQSMAWLHTWTGLLVGWVLLLIFMAGTAAYYRAEISRWMRPELPHAKVDPVQAVNMAEAYLARNAADALSWTIVMPTAREPQLQLYWRNPEMPGTAPSGRASRFGEATLDPVTGKRVAARETRGGDFFYRLHFDLHYIPVYWARYIVGFCAMFMLVAIITGVITHKKIFTDFFTFRPGKGLRSWLDFHNVGAVMALPYHAMITYTGIVTLMFMYLPWTVKSVYPEGQDQFFEEVFGNAASPAATGVAGTALPLSRLLQRAIAELPGMQVGGIQIDHPGDAASTVQFRGGGQGTLSVRRPMVLLAADSGTVLQRFVPEGGATVTHGVMVGLHRADFASPLLRLLFFGSGLLGCLMVASGVILWAVKERPSHLKAGRIGFGLRLVDALNIGTVAGLPMAFASYFWANRLLPVALEGRADAEIRVFFLMWLAALVAAFAWPRRAMWAWQLYVGASLFGLVPLLNAFTTEVHLAHTLAAGDWARAGVDLACLFLGLCLAIAGWRMQHWRPPLSAAQKRAATITKPVVSAVATQERA